MNNKNKNQSPLFDLCVFGANRAIRRQEQIIFGGAELSLNFLLPTRLTHKSHTNIRELERQQQCTLVKQQQQESKKATQFS